MMGHVKGVVWARENEWRLMWKNDETRMRVVRCPIIKGSVVGIYFGLNLSESAKSDFAIEAKNSFPEAGLFSAKKRLGGLALDFDAV